MKINIPSIRPRLTSLNFYSKNCKTHQIYLKQKYLKDDILYNEKSVKIVITVIITALNIYYIPTKCQTLC